MKRSRIIIPVSAVLFLAVLAVVGGAWYFSSMLIYPKHTCNPEHYVYCGSPGGTGLPFEEVTLTTDDGLALKGWFMPGSTRKAVLFVYGHGGGRNVGMRYAGALHRAGFSLIAFDQRNVDSDHEGYCSMGYHERKDVRAAVDFLVNTKGMESIGIMGFSLGGSISVLAMAEDDRIRAGVFNSSYSNVSDVLAEVAKDRYGLPRYPLIPVVLLFNRFRVGMEAGEINAEEKIESISPRPVLIMHCKGDPMVNADHSARLYRAAQEPKELWIAECDRHVWIWNSQREEAEKRVTAFFRGNL